jgi:GntR family transcriptional regulator
MENSINLALIINPQSGVPIYRQVMEQLRSLVASGRLKSGELVPSVRQLSQSLAVNPMTISKAYARLELEGLLERERGIGMRIKLNADQIPLKERLTQLEPVLEQLVAQAWQLKLTKSQILASVESFLKAKGYSHD